jgi:archaellum component FlaC
MSNNITKQVITELETIKAIASELADMSPRTQMEIVALCKEICLNVDKVLEAHELDITTLFNYINVIDNEITELQNHGEVIDERLENLEASILAINESIGGINQTLSTHTSQIQGLENNKQDVLTAGENITIENNVISASGGGGAQFYQHSIAILYNATFIDNVTTTFITRDNTPFDYNKIVSFLVNKGFTNQNILHEASGYERQNSVYNAFGLFSYDNEIRIRALQSANSQVATRTISTVVTINDNIFEL